MDLAGRRALIRLALPSFILCLFYWLPFVHPWGAASANLTAAESRKLLNESTQLLLEQRYQDALEPVLRLHNADPYNHVHLSRLAIIFSKIGRPAEEAHYWEMFFERAPLPIEACPQIGVAYQKQSKMDESIRAFERCLALDPENTDSIFYLAHALERKGDMDRALGLYQRGLTIAPDYIDLRIGVARVELHRGRSKQAKEMSLQTLRRAPDNPDALLLAGLASWGCGDRLAARVYLERGAKLANNDPDFQIALARLMKEERR